MNVAQPSRLTQSGHSWVQRSNTQSPAVGFDPAPLIAGFELRPKAALKSSSLKSLAHTMAERPAPTNCARMKPGTWLMAMPANVVVNPRAIVTAGFANDVDAVNQ
jgi:hypothetical protein